MQGSFPRIALFTVIVVLFFVYIGEVLTRISGEGGRLGRTVGEEVSPEAGETIFWGKGTCYTCHSIGTRGSAIRCPNLGEGPQGPPVGARAAMRAEERAEQGKPMTPTDYLVESLIDPGAHVVEGYKNEMPVIWKPPIALTADEIKAVVAYLQSQGATVDMAAIKLPEEVVKAGTERGTEGEEKLFSALLAKGNPEMGREIFFDPAGNAACAKCHAVGGQGGQVGPELTHIAATQPVEYIMESILEPGKVIASGFEPVLLITTDGRYISGTIKSEDETAITLADSNADLITVAKSEIRQRVPQSVSLMPGNFSEILTLEEFTSVLAYVLTLK